MRDDVRLLQSFVFDLVAAYKSRPSGFCADDMEVMSCVSDWLAATVQAAQVTEVVFRKEKSNG